MSIDDKLTFELPPEFWRKECVNTPRMIINQDHNVPFRNQYVIRKTVHDHATLALLDDIRQDGQAGRQAGVTVREDVDVATLGPGDVRWRVDGTLDIFTVEVYRRDLDLHEGSAVRMGQLSIADSEGMKPYGKPRTSHRIGHWKKEFFG